MLPTGLEQQLLFCLRFAGLGAVLGIFYDILRALRMHFRLKRWGTGLLDMVFCLVGLVGFLLMMLRGTDGRLRAFLCAGLAAGFFAYRKTVSRWMLALFLKLLQLGGQAVRLLRETLLWLFSFPRGN